MAQFSGYFELSNETFITFNNAVVDSVLSSCANVTNNSTSQQSKLTIKFDCGYLDLIINRENNSRTYVKPIHAFFQLSTNQTVQFLNSTELFGTTQANHYYKCNAEQQVLGNGGRKLVFSNFALEAFRDVTGTDFYQIADDCELDAQPVSDLVRIGVGVCLIGLVAIVLIAYFIGRKRWAERQSYESV